MPIFLVSVTRLNSIMQLLGLAILFVFVLAATYFTSKWVGAYGQKQVKNKNIKIIETYRINQNKYIQIIKVADKYLAIAVSKDNVEFLTEIEEANLNLLDDNKKNAINFNDIFSKAIHTKDVNKQKNNNL